MTEDRLPISRYLDVNLVAATSKERETLQAVLSYPISTAEGRANAGQSHFQYYLPSVQEEGNDLGNPFVASPQ